MPVCDVETANRVLESVPALRINPLRHFADVAGAELRARLFDQVDGKNTELDGRSRNVEGEVCQFLRATRHQGGEICAATTAELGATLGLRHHRFFIRRSQNLSFSHFTAWPQI